MMDAKEVMLEMLMLGLKTIILLIKHAQYIELRDIPMEQDVMLKLNVKIVCLVKDAGLKIMLKFMVFQNMDKLKDNKI